MVDDRVALGAEFVNEAANAHLIVTIGALECGDFRMHEAFQLACAGDGALDAFVHGVDFAANGLTDGHDALRGNGLRLGQPQRDFGHRTRHVLHVLRTGNHDGEGKEEQDR